MKESNRKGYGALDLPAWMILLGQIFLWPVIYCFPNSWGVPWDAVVLFNIVWVGMLLSIPTAYALEFFGRTVMKVVEKLRK